MLTSVQIAAAFLRACELDVQALKPGNVSMAVPAHGMRAEDFLMSARAAAVHIARPGASVGERILDATRATRSVVQCNTNLGILLLCAPLAAALESSLHAVLARLDRRDARLTFAAIRMASPGGLGKAPRHDVHSVPRVNLRAAMRDAEHRDRIARQYVRDYEDVFSVGLPVARTALAEGRSQRWAMTQVYLTYLSRFPDSHIERKFGPQAARAVQRDARPYAIELRRTRVVRAVASRLRGWDNRLKAAALNPGTSADLCVATWFALLLEDALKKA